MAENKKKNFSFGPPKTHLITVESGKRMVMEGVEDILYCNTERMVLQSKFRLVVLGESLSLEELGNKNMAVCGKIGVIFFGEEKK